MTEKSQTRLEIEEEMTQIGATAVLAGRCAREAIRQAFPGAPENVVAKYGLLAACRASAVEADRWFGTLERTIDGEVIRAAARAAADEAAERDRRIAMATNMARGLRLVPKTKRTGKGAPK